MAWCYSSRTSSTTETSPAELQCRPSVRLFAERRSAWRLTLHYYAQNAVDARLVAFAMTLKPSEHVLIQANRQLPFRGGPGHRRLLEKGLVEPRNVRIVNIAILRTVNPCQVALDRFSVQVDFPFSRRGCVSRHREAHAAMTTRRPASKPKVMSRSSP